MWAQWEEDSAWSDQLLTTVQTSFPSMHQEGDSEEETAKRLSVYQVRGGSCGSGCFVVASVSRALQLAFLLVHLPCCSNGRPDISHVHLGYKDGRKQPGGSELQALLVVSYANSCNVNVQTNMLITGWYANVQNNMLINGWYANDQTHMLIVMLMY